MPARPALPRIVAAGVAVTALVAATTLIPSMAGAQTLRSARIGAGTADAERVAIVIGNQDYETVSDLANARKDAEDIASMLRAFRFNVFDGYDLDKRGFEELLRTAMVNIPDGADVVFYYAGHGIQIGRRNYLLPVDASFASIYDVPIETMTLDRVIDTLAARGSAHVAILDSCRDNPFPNVRLAADLDANLFETRDGFDVFRTPLNSLVAFSTSPGAVAWDGAQGKNSPYTAAILEATREAPTDNVQDLFPLVREMVHTATGGDQVPWESSTLVRPFYLASANFEAEQISQADTTQAGEAPLKAETPTDSAPGEVRSSEPVTVPVSLNARFDRSVPLAARLERALGQSFGEPELVTPPQAGLLSLNTPDGASIRYVPEIADVRAADLESETRSDRFQLDVTTADGVRRRVSVELSLPIDACDLAAGDALDIDGIGIYRQANELDIANGLDACEKAIAVSGGTPRFHYQMGRLMQSTARYAEAYDHFRTAAEAGHVRAKHGLAVMLSTARIDRALHDVPFDPERARALLEEGIAVRDPYAMHRLGQQLLRTGDTEAERNRGFELLEAAVELGHTYSMNELGIYFLTPDSGHYIPERGMRYLQASRDREDIYGYSNLAFVALNGLDGETEDFTAAYSMYRTATDGGHPTAPSMIARMILNDQIDGQSTADALRWYDLSLGRGDGWGGANGAIIIQQEQVPGKGPADAALRAARAALLANSEAAEVAREVLTELPGSALDRATQMTLKDLGQDVAVDGQVGPATRAAITRASEAAGLADPASNDPLDRLLHVSRLYWAANPVRYDLF